MTIAVATSGCGSEKDDELRIRETVSSFLQEAYGPGGNVDFAYAMLASETRASCAREDFEAMVMAAREANGDRSLQADRFAQIQIAGHRATLKVDADYDLSPRYFPIDATVVKEDGEWRYLVTTDPSCKSVAQFFGHEVN